MLISGSGRNAWLCSAKCTLKNDGRDAKRFLLHCDRIKKKHTVHAVGWEWEIKPNMHVILMEKLRKHLNKGENDKTA